MCKNSTLDSGKGEPAPFILSEVIIRIMHKFVVVMVINWILCITWVKMYYNYASTKVHENEIDVIYIYILN